MKLCILLLIAMFAVLPVFSSAKKKGGKSGGAAAKADKTKGGKSGAGKVDGPAGAGVIAHDGEDGEDGEDLEEGEEQRPCDAWVNDGEAEVNCGPGDLNTDPEIMTTQDKFHEDCCIMQCQHYPDAACNKGAHLYSSLTTKVLHRNMKSTCCTKKQTCWNYNNQGPYPCDANSGLQLRTQGEFDESSDPVYKTLNGDPPVIDPGATCCAVPVACMDPTTATLKASSAQYDDTSTQQNVQDCVRIATKAKPGLCPRCTIVAACSHKGKDGTGKDTRDHITVRYFRIDGSRLDPPFGPTVHVQPIKDGKILPPVAVSAAEGDGDKDDDLFAPLLFVLGTIVTIGACCVLRRRNSKQGEYSRLLDDEI